MPLFSRAGYSPLIPPPTPQPPDSPQRSPSPTSSARLSLHTALSILPSPTSSVSSNASHYPDRSLIRRPESCSPRHSPVRLQITASTPIVQDPSHALRIEIVGTPKPFRETKLKSDDIFSPVPLSDDFELLLEDGEVFAELDACNEDPFTLERFHTLITLHAEKHKDFIIARVATKDGGSSPDREETSSHDKADGEGEGNEKYYYSYYTAHHINKVLFRTQPDEGLLHRMRAKNPLNNLTIVGDVHYFVIEWEHAQSVLAEHRRLTAPVANTMQTFAQASMDTFATLMNSLSTTLGVSRSAPTRRRSDPSIPVQSLTRSNRKDQPVLLQLYMQPEALEAGFPPLTASYDASEGVGTPRRLRSRSSGAVEVNQLAEVSLRNLQTPLSDEKLRGSLAPKESLRRRSPTKASAGEVTDGRNPPEMEVRRKSKERLREFYGTVSKSDRTEDAVYRDLLKDNDVLATAHSLKMEQPRHKSSTFTAKYYASDDDFLMHASVRTYFRANALESDDAVLFTIPSSSQDRTTIPSDVETEAHPALPAFRFARTENDREARESTSRKIIVGAAIVAFVLFSVLVIKFAVPHSLMVFALVIIVVVLCFMVVLLKMV